MIIDQTASERQLHRVLYVIKLLRAMVLHLTLAAIGAVLYFTTGITNAYPVATALIQSMHAQVIESDRNGTAAPPLVFGVAVLIAFGVVLAMLIWMYRSLTSVRRHALRIQALVVLGLGGFTCITSLNGLLFAHRQLHPLFSFLAAISVIVVSIVVPVSVAAALFGVSRLQERSSMVATLDPRLAPTRRAYLAKLLDLPRTPLRTPQALAAFALSLAGALMMIASLMYLLTLGGMSNKLATLKTLAPYATHSELVRASVVESVRVVWLLPLAVAGIKLAALLQSLARRIGGLSLTDAITNPDDRFLLYLRPFDLDEVILPRPRLSIGNRLFSFRPYPARIEEELFDVADGYLPLIAIGKPGTAGAARGGLAYRTFLADADWQAFAADRIRRADRIVMVVEETPGVRWEIARILADGAALKTLFFFRPHPGIEASGPAAQPMMVTALRNAGLVRPDFTFEAGPIGFYLGAQGDVVEIVNGNWSATSYRTAFSHFLAETAGRAAPVVAAR